MKQFFLLVIPLTLSLHAQEVLVQQDNGNPGGIYSNLPSFSEESVLLTPVGPCKVLEIRIYYGGGSASTDTVWIVGDPSEGAVPPTGWVWSYNTKINPVIVQYNGLPGWRTIDVRSANLRSDGYDRIVIQHRVKPSGPWWVVDNGTSQGGVYNSFLMNPTETNPLGGPGVYYVTQGRFMVRLLVQYDFPQGNGSQSPPSPTLVDVTKSAGLVNASNELIKSVNSAVADWNNDGFDDVAIGGTYFQNNGNGTFSNVTTSLGIGAGSPIWADYDNDGFIDAYLINGGDNDKLFRNNGNGTFSDVTASSKITNAYPTVTPIWLDYNNDGRLDLFIANGRRTVGNQEVYYPDQLWRNEGSGTFTNVTASSGIVAGEPSPYYDCWGASACDFDNDGLTDIFVNTYRLAPDLLYRNNGNGTFTEVGAATGVRGVPTQSPQYFGHGMGSDWGDFDNDGDLDVAVGNLGHPDWRGAVSNPSLVFRNNGPQAFNFTNVTPQAGLKFFEMNAGPAWVDLDHDGFLDLWSCQYAYNAEGTNNEPRRLSRVYINDGPPNFSMRDRTWHLGSLSHGAWTVSRIDFDNDGDADLIVSSPTEGAKLFRNDVAKRGRALTIRLKGSPSDRVNMDAFGTIVRVYADGRQFLRTLSTNSAGSRGAQHSSELHFGLGNAVKIDSVVVIYPNGVHRYLTTLEPDKKYFIPYNGNPQTDIEQLIAPQAWRIAWTDYRDGNVRFMLEGMDDLSEASISLYNLAGRLIGTEQHAARRGLNQLRIDLSTGGYLLVIKTAIGERAAKFVVMKSEL